mmetsp:Transcript_9892/g.25592  ORF Transcript_9892/g.25592 Transcript_9892/m.25592 type:complete len:352 (+) Transcript_9892:56-1111(+)
MARLTAILLAAIAGVASGITKEKLSDWLYSSKGLNVWRVDADKIANREYMKLSSCRVTLDMLQALKDSMYSTSKLGLSKQEVQANIFQLAEQHVDPENLVLLYTNFYSTSSADLSPKSKAQGVAMELAKKKVSGKDIPVLWKILYSISGVNLPKSEAQRWVVDLTAAGANSQKLLDSYKDNFKRMDKAAAFKAAIADSVDSNLYGLPTRYAKDIKPYVAKEFQTYYHDQWLVEWLAAPKEKRTAQDGHDYIASEFQTYFGDSWNTKWAASPVAEQKRIAADGKTYTMQEFQAYYKDTWQQEFFKSAEIADECAFLNNAACSAARDKCIWKFTGDWTDSCILKTSKAADNFV